LCALVGQKKFDIIDAWCNHEIQLTYLLFNATGFGVYYLYEIK